MGLYFLRHGESVANVEKTFAGQSDSPLTERGLEQAAQEARRLQEEDVDFDVIISSPLSRARDTAEVVAAGIGYNPKAIVFSELLYERAGGEGEGKTLNEFFALAEAEQVALGAESFATLGERAVKLLAELEQAYPSSDDILLVSHATFGEMLQTMLKYNDPSKILDGEKIPNARTIKLK